MSATVSTVTVPASQPPSGTRDLACEALEEAGYLSTDNGQIYYVVHPTAHKKKGRVLLAGFFGSDRPRRYIPWVRWARFLAMHGYEAVRFDYRGMGESTGRFEQMSFSSWLEDLYLVADYARLRGDEPLILHGLGLGALLASRAFEQGLGDALLLWLPPDSGRQVLYENLKIRLAHDFALMTKDRKTRDQYVAAIEAGEPVELEGYFLTKQLWDSAEQFELSPNEMANQQSDANRPRHVAELDELAKHVLSGVGPNPVRTADGGKPLQLVNPDLSPFYSTNLAWIKDAMSQLPSAARQVAPKPSVPSKSGQGDRAITRKALQLTVEGHRLFGTLHPASVSEKGAEKNQPSDSVGILFLSFGQQPRSWVGDLGSYAADRLCKIGYPVYRFDMPGLGDSPGDLPLHLEVLWRAIQEGAHKTIAQALVRKLKEQDSLRGLIVAGFCGGAVTAAYAADRRDKDVLAVILLEPEIALTATSTPNRKGEEIENVAKFWRRWHELKGKLRSRDAWIRLLSGKSDLEYWRGIYRYMIRRIRERRGGQKLPPETNLQLLDVWERLQKQKLPTLVLSAGIPARRRYYRAYGLGPDASNTKSKLTWIEIPGTTHAMLAGGAKEAVPEHMERWIREQVKR